MYAPFSLIGAVIVAHGCTMFREYWSISKTFVSSCLWHKNLGSPGCKILKLSCKNPINPLAVIFESPDHRVGKHIERQPFTLKCTTANNSELSVYLTCMSFLWTLGWNWSARRKPTQNAAEHWNSPDISPIPSNIQYLLCRSLQSMWSSPTTYTLCVQDPSVLSSTSRGDLSHTTS